MFGDDCAAPAAIRVKICGITNEADALAAVSFGANALGFNFYRGSKRYVTPEEIEPWASQLPGHIRRVAIIVDEELERATNCAELPFIDALQLHGQETPAYCDELARRGIAFGKALGVSTAQSLGKARAFRTRTLILDSLSAGSFGGSGKVFPWEIARDFVSENPELRIVLAGGLTPENVAEAVGFVRPFAVDVTSGVERFPGRKDHGLLSAFIAAARAA